MKSSLSYARTKPVLVSVTTVLALVVALGLPDAAMGQSWKRRMKNLKRRAKRASQTVSHKAQKEREKLRRKTDRAYRDATAKAKKLEEKTGRQARDAYNSGKKKVDVAVGGVKDQAARHYRQTKYYIRHDVPRIIERDSFAIESSIRALRGSMGLSDRDYAPPLPRPAHTVPNPAIREVLFPPVCRVGEPVYIKVVAENLGSAARQGGISLAFPDAGEINVLQASDDATDVSVYPEGYKLYSSALRRTLRSSYPLVETYSWSRISAGSTYSISAFVVPSHPGEFRFYVRTALRGGGKDFYGYPLGEGFPKDQQLWPVLEYSLVVK